MQTRILHLHIEVFADLALHRRISRDCLSAVVERRQRIQNIVVRVTRRQSTVLNIRVSCRRNEAFALLASTAPLKPPPLLMRLRVAGGKAGQFSLPIHARTARRRPRPSIVGTPNCCVFEYCGPPKNETESVGLK